MNVYQNLSTCCIWNLYGWILRSKDEHVFCWSVCQFKKRSHIRMFVGRSVVGPVPWWMQTFRAAPSSKPLMMCHETISARPGSKEVVAIQHFGEVLSPNGKVWYGWWVLSPNPPQKTMKILHCEAGGGWAETTWCGDPAEDHWECAPWRG